MKFLMNFCLTILSFATTAHASSAHHGMVIFGDKVIYASHLAMFHAPHDYQAIFQISLGNIPRSETLTYYQYSKESGSASVYTLLSDLVDLEAVISGAQTSFVATLYEGHFEQGGNPLGPVRVSVTKVVYASQIDQAFESPSSYLLFGGDGEYFAAHMIGGQPNFDAIFVVSLPIYTYQEDPCTRLCGVQMAYPDEYLPVGVSSDKSFPSPGDIIGSEPHSMVLDLIYFENL